MSPQERDYYTTLQVHPRAEQEVIEAAYRRLAAKYHPDRNSSPEAAQRMKDLNAAHEVLGNPEKRRSYDALVRLGSPNVYEGSTHAPTLPPTVGKAIRVLLPLAVFLLSLGVMRLSPQLGLIVLLALLAFWTYYSKTRRRS